MSESTNTAEAIGDIAIEFGNLELHVNHIFSRLVNQNDPEIGLIIASNIFSVRVKLEIIKYLFTHRHETESQSKEFNDLYNDMTGVIQKRNDIIHSAWFAETEGIRPATKSSRKREVQVRFHDVASLTQICDEINDVTDQFLSYMFPIICQSLPSKVSTDQNTSLV